MKIQSIVMKLARRKSLLVLAVLGAGLFAVWLARRAREVPEAAPAAVRQVGEVAKRHWVALLVGAAALAGCATVFGVFAGGARTPAGAFSGTVCTWTDASGTPDISVADNWAPTASCGGTSTAPGTALLGGAQLSFPSSPPNSITSLTDNYPESADDIVLGTSYSISGSYALSLSGASNAGVGIEVTSGSPSIAVPLTLTASQTFEVASGWSLTVTGAISSPNYSLIAGAAGFTGSVVLNSSTAPSSLGFTAAAGTLVADTSLSVGTAPITVDAGATLALSPVCPSSQSFGNTLTLNGTLYDKPTGSGCGEVWTGAITLGGAATVESNNSVFTVAGSIGESVASPLTIVGDTSGDSVALSPPASPTNTYTGGTTVRSGQLHLQNTTAAGPSTSTITVDDNASLVLDASGTYPYGLTLGSTYGGASLQSAVSGTTWGGSISLVSNATGSDSIANNASSSTFNISGCITGTSLYSGGVSGTVNVLGCGTNSYTGQTTVASGTLKLGAANAIPSGYSSSALNVAASAILDLNGYSTGVGAMTGLGSVNSSTGSPTLTCAQTGASTFPGTISGNLALTMSGAGGNLTLAGYNTYAGSTIVQAGTLTLAAMGAVPSITTFTVDSGATLAMNNNGGSALSFNNALTLGSGAGGNGTLDDASSVSGDSWTGTVTLLGSAMDSIISGSPSFTVSGAIVSSGGAQLHTSSPGSSSPVTLTASNASFTSGITVNAGALMASGSSATSALGAGQVIVGDGATLELNPPIVSTFPSTLSLQLGSGTGGATLMDMDGTGDTWAGSISLVGSLGDIIESSSGNFKVTGGISGSSLTTDGASSIDYVVLAGTNSYTGSTSVSSGNLQLFNANAYPSGSALSVFPGATFDLDGNSASVSTLSDLGTITSSSGTPVLTDTTSGSDSLSGVLAGTLSLTMNGVGALTLSGTGSYSGTVTVAQGTLVLASANAAATGAITVDDGATLELTASPSSNIPLTLGSTNGGATLFDNSSGTGDIWPGMITLKGGNGDILKSSTPNFDVTGIISGASSMTTLGVSGSSGTGWVSLQGNNTYSGGTTVVSGTLSLRYSAAAGTGSVTVDGGATLNLWGSAVGYTFSNSLFLGSSSGGGVLDDTSTNGSTWSGPVTLAGNGDVIESTNTGFLLTNAISSTTGSGLVISPGLTDSVTLAGNDSYAGSTSVLSDTLLLGSSTAIPSGSALNIASGATVDLHGFSSSVGGLAGAGTITSSTGSPTLTDTTTGSDVFSGPIVGSLGLTMQGSLAGILTLSGTCTYTGATTVASGTLNVTGSLAGAVTVQANGFLEGSGAIVGAVSAVASGALVFPGVTSPAVLTTGSAAIETGGQLDIDITGTTAGSGYSQLVVSTGGTVNITGGILNVSPSFAAPQGTTFDILVNKTGYPVIGSFSVGGSPVPEGGTFTVAGQTFGITYVGGTSGGDVVLTSLTPPAPPPPPPTSTTSLSLSSSASSLAPGSSATFTATVTTTTTKSGTTTTTPDAGASVSFDVSSGPDAGKTASGVTDASGVATFTYVNNGTSGTDQVTATASGASWMATATVSFTGQYTLTLASSAPGSDEGTPVSLTATLTDPSGASVTGGAISFTITGPDAASSTSVATGSSGTAVLTLDATTTGTDSVSASYTTPASPSAPASILTSNTVTVKWAAPATIAPTSSPTGTSPGSPSNPLLPGQQISLSVIVTQSAPAAIKFHFGTFPTQSWFGFSFVSSHRPSHSDTTSAPAFFPLSSYPHATTVPAVGVPVVFAVSAGPDAGQGATVNTDSTGTATWTYSGTGAGTDAVGATFTDSAGVAHTAHFAVSWSTTATTTTSSTSTSSTSTTVAPTTTATTVPPTPTTTAPTRSVPPGYVAPPAPTPIVFSPVAPTPTPTPGSSTSPTTAPTTTSTTLKSTSTTAVKKAPSSQSHAKSSSNRATSTTLSPQALGVTSTGGVVSVDGVTNNSNGNDVPPAAVKALVAAGQSGPAMPFNKGYGLGAGGGPPGPAPLARSIPTPTQALHAIKKTVKDNGLLSFLLIFLIGLPAIAFNSALKEHHASLASSHGALRRLVDSVEARLENLHGAVLLVAFAVIGSVLYALDDPAFGFNLGSLAEIVGYVGAILVSTTATEVLRGVYVHRRFQKVGDLRAFPLGIVVAIVFDAFSRLSHFEPGYVFGILAAIVFRVKPTGEEDGRSMTYASMWLLGLAVASWFAFGVVNGAVIAGNHHFWMLAAESLLSYVWICGLQSLFFGLIPARYMDGDAIFSWSKIAWAALYLVVTFTFVQFILHPTTSGFGGNKNTNLFSMLAIFIVSAVAGLTFWLYSHLRFGRTRGPGLEMVSLGEE